MKLHICANVSRRNIVGASLAIARRRRRKNCRQNCVTERAFLKTTLGHPSGETSVSEREKDMSTMVMDYVRDFMEDVKHDRALQLKTFITVVLSITGFSLFCVEDARLHKANDVVHFTQGERETSPPPAAMAAMAAMAVGECSATDWKACRAPAHPLCPLSLKLTN